ncbi:glutaredoxin family protein [Cyanobacterium aponinum]|uniref:Glutaredoxin family protein n=1 Tax=Cyanobacterium aponinum 0216 TaxID=2676140 RepID=A0A844H3F4_9CHRO|nr:glutaredoxin family protein [Cyanobacterium aponinum]MTF40686.1 glutaredoxin family protein [Cyanobacterium aponinum 0216]
MELILYSKTGCHLCEGLEEKLRAIDDIDINLEIRDITKNKEWWEKYQYEIPVLYLAMDGQEKLIPRNSPRISVNQLSKVLQKFANKQ